MEGTDHRDWHIDTEHNPYGSPERIGTSGGSPKSHHSANSEMLDLKLGRKKAESELQQLANRVALLKMEEHKAQEKVKETKMRAAEIVEIKRRNEERLIKKIQSNQEREKEIRAVQAKAAQEREERQRKLSNARKTVADDRKAAVERQKEESKRLEDLASQGRTYTELEKRLRAEEGRRRQEVLKKQRDKEKKMKEEQAMREYLRKMEEEASRKRQAEEMMTLLERQERELLERLRKSQQEQQEAFNALQNTLRS